MQSFVDTIYFRRDLSFFPGVLQWLSQGLTRCPGMPTLILPHEDEGGTDRVVPP